METPLKIPDKLTYLIAHRHWPTADAHFMGQDIKFIIPEELVQAVFPGERRFCFAKPPFSLVSQMKSEHACFWDQDIARPDQIVRDLSLVIGDFEIGSDSAVILDYSETPDNPCVKWLRWGRTEPRNEWVTACQSFDEFADRLQLERIYFPPSTTSWWKSLFGIGSREPKREHVVGGNGV